eukprot:CAMPEP_0183587158 /NCGR_PEP_ID=MMETSP0371-20130417/158465_1 /TAXON_ID=268820 /ORGANISM="Peridinium aciculiferum, Strain PAER-2" /LENGTH=44 /DNA_ID= /DNA_START= /DNA_END= /DNA_ORIENTATION=
MAPVKSRSETSLRPLVTVGLGTSYSRNLTISPPPQLTEQLDQSD